MIRGLLCVDCVRPIRGRSEFHPKPLKNQSVGHSSANRTNSPLSVFNNLDTPAPLDFRLSPVFPSDYALPLQNRGVGVGNFYLSPNQQLTNSRLSTNFSALPVGITQLPAACWRAWPPEVWRASSHLSPAAGRERALCVPTSVSGIPIPPRLITRFLRPDSIGTRHSSPFLCTLGFLTPL